MSRKPASPWKRARRRVMLALVVALGPPLLRLLAATWRVRRLGVEHWESARGQGAPPVFALWHENIPAGVALHGHMQLTVMISRHHDGEFITRLARRLGFRVARGSTYGGGVAALKEMLQEAREGHGLVVTPDGPRGPRRSVAPGILFLSAATGRPLMAVGVAASRAWRAGSWDRMMIPKPFARVAVAFEPGLGLPREGLREPGRAAGWSVRLVELMDGAQRAAEAALGGRTPA